MREKNRGFTLVEMVITLSIFTILLGIMVPSLNSILGFRVQRATNSIAAALDKTRIEAMSRLVGEMKLEKRSDGYYISYYLDRGKQAGPSYDQAEKIAPARTRISYFDSAGTEVPMEVNTSLILTYTRASGGFRKIQRDVLTQEEIDESLAEGKDVSFKDSGTYCEKIKVSGGMRTRYIQLYPYTGKYDITAG